jgi:hypothetical protein
LGRFVFEAAQYDVAVPSQAAALLKAPVPRGPGSFFATIWQTSFAVKSDAIAISRQRRLRAAIEGFGGAGFSPLYCHRRRGRSDEQ